MSTTKWKAAWTGGQYSVVRAGAAVMLAGLLLHSTFASGGFDNLAAALAVTALALALGIGGRALAVVFATLLPFGIGESADATTVALAGTWLFLHMGLPRAPYGSLAARGRTDPGGHWSMPAWYPFCCQALFVLTRFGSGMQAVMDGHSYLAAAFVVPGVLALAPPSALLAWSLSLLVEFWLALGGDLSFGAVVFLHLLTFQPAWIARRESDEPATVFYDGSCALCHAAVRFLLAEDVEPPRFRIAPLGGQAFAERVPESVRVRRPDSIVLVRGDEVLLRSAAVIAVLDALGGIWGLIAAVLGLLPVSLADAAYDAIAARRYRWFGRRSEACPVMPAAQRTRLDA